MDAFCFVYRGPAFMMPFRAGLAFSHQLLLKLEHEVGIFAVRSRNDAELLREPKSFIEFLIGDAKGSFVRQKNFETAHAAFDDVHELLLRRIIISGDTHVKREIASTLACSFAQP